MRYAILSDVHGNYDALEAVFRSIRAAAVDHLICLGDVVGYGPQPLECLRALRRHNATILAGNHDYACAHLLDISTFNVYARESTLWTQEVLDPETLEYLAELPLRVEFEGFTAVHGSPQAPELFDYLQTCYEAGLSMAAMDQPLCFVGHSHVPIAFLERECVVYTRDAVHKLEPSVKTIINVGSVGQPRDHDPRACYAIYDSREGTVQLERVQYDITATIAKMDAAGLPRPLGERLRSGR